MYIGPSWYPQTHKQSVKNTVHASGACEENKHVVCLCRLLNILANLFKPISESTLFANMTFKSQADDKTDVKLLWLAV